MEKELLEVSKKPEMIESTVLVLFRSNLTKDKEKLPFRKITLNDFKYDGSIRRAYQENIIMFVDEDCKTKILKNRYGKPGIVK